jgi:hypothetical protein
MHIGFEIRQQLVEIDSHLGLAVAQRVHAQLALADRQFDPFQKQLGHAIGLREGRHADSAREKVTDHRRFTRIC